MNRTYHLVWNPRINALVAVSEIAKRRGNSGRHLRAAAGTAVLLVLQAGPALATCMSGSDADCPLLNFTPVYQVNAVDPGIAMAAPELLAATMDLGNTPEADAAVVQGSPLNGNPPEPCPAFPSAPLRQVANAHSEPAQTGESLPGVNRVAQARTESTRGVSSANAVPGYKSATTGLVIGAYIYARSDFESPSQVAQKDVDAYGLTGYVRYNLDHHTDINFHLGVFTNQARSRHQIGFADSAAAADFDNLTWHAGAGIGRVWPLTERTSATPSLRLDYTRIRSNSHSETAARPLNLDAVAQVYKGFLVTGEVKLAHQIRDSLNLVGTVGVGYDALNKSVQTASTFTGGGPALLPPAPEPSPWLCRVGLGLIQDDGKGREYALRYDVEGRTSGHPNHTLSLRLRWIF